MTSLPPGGSPLDYLVLPDGKTPASTLLNRPAPAPAEPEPSPRAFVLAHALGHALDPRYQFDPQDYDGVRKSGYEVVAEASAVNALRSFGLVLDDADRYLDERFPRRWFPGGWRKSLEWGLCDRYMCALLPLLKPAPDDEHRKRMKIAGRSWKRERRAARQRQKRR